MDLFHTITQEIESVISCHWLSEFRDHQRTSRASSCSTSTNTSRSPNPETSTSRSRSIDSVRDRSPVLSRTNSGNSLTTDNMSDQLMDTEKGGEQTQYEGIKTFTKPHAKQSGQLGDPSTGTTTDASSDVDADRAQKTTENIRYGQNMSESGMGGMTTTSTGDAAQEGGYGGTESSKELERTDNPRTEQGYSAKDGVHDYSVGA